MRRSELMMLTWRQIDFATKCVRLEKTKNGDRRTIPLTGHALEQMEKQNKIRRIDTQLVFPNISGRAPLTIRRPWCKAIENAGIDNFRFHDLRHSAASYLAMNGASMIEIAAVLGHRTMQMVKRYSHIAESHTHPSKTARPITLSSR
jgi:integrase